jgi:hypothetical protein
MYYWIGSVVVVAMTGGRAFADPPSASDEAGIRATALDYMEGFFDGSGERMARALHPELVKRIVIVDPKTKRTFVQTAVSKGAARHPLARRRRVVLAQRGRR